MNNQFFDVKLFINHDEQKWECSFFDATREERVGFIEGDIEQVDNNLKAYVVSQSELNEEYRGKGLGLLMYKLVIQKCLIFCNEVRSSTNLNDFSKSTWIALERRYYNVEGRSRPKYWCAFHSNKEII
jgi:hypothetical protein